MATRIISHLDVEKIKFGRYVRVNNFTIEQAYQLQIVGDEGFNIPIDDYYIAKKNVDYHSNNKFIWHGNSKSVAEFVNVMNEFISKWENLEYRKEMELNND